MQAKDPVVTAAAVFGPIGAFVIHQERPKIGVIESLVGGSPPTTVVVVWEDGTRVSYAAVNSGATAVLFKLGLSVIPLVGNVAQPKAGMGTPNPGARLQGTIIMHFSLEDGAGTPFGEFVVIDTPTGFLVIPASNITVLPSA